MLMSVIMNNHFQGIFRRTIIFILGFSHGMLSTFLFSEEGNLTNKSAIVLGTTSFFAP